VPDRLTPLDVSFLYLEEPATAMHVGSVLVFQSPEGGFDHQRLVRHVAARIAYVPRYRQRVRWVPARLANPVWVDDEDFDISYHVRRSALPRPGSMQQLRELVARVQARPLDRTRPLWEAYVVEGLEDDRFALITKTHQAMVDGARAVDLGQVVLDESPDAAQAPPDSWRPGHEPTLVELVTSAVMDSVRRPGQVVETLRAGVGDLKATAGKAAGTLGGLAVAARTATRPAPTSPLNAGTSEHRRFGTVATDLEQYRRVRAHHAADRARPRSLEVPVLSSLSINDVVLATVAGALRSWLLTRGEPVTPTTTVRALAPVSVLDPQAGAQASTGTGSPTGSVAVQLVDLPVGEGNPVLRLHQIAYQMEAHDSGGRAVGARALAGLAGFAPPTIHSLGMRVAGGLSRRLFNLLVTNAPGPQHPLYAAGARMLESYPVMPLARGQALSVGVTSYDGGVFYGLNADRAAMPDIDVLAQCVADSLEELEGTVR
jgi:diacylglycerol O-acyltransferase / wax synthase